MSLRRSPLGYMNLERRTLSDTLRTSARLSSGSRYVSLRNISERCSGPCQRLFLYIKTDVQMRSTEADLLKAIEEQTAGKNIVFASHAGLISLPFLAMQSFSLAGSSGLITLYPWPWIDDTSDARFPSSQPIRAQPVEPADLSDAISHKSSLPKYSGPYSLVYMGEYRGVIVAVKILQSPGATTHAMRRVGLILKCFFSLIACRKPGESDLYGHAWITQTFCHSTDTQRTTSALGHLVP